MPRVCYFVAVLSVVAVSASAEIEFNRDVRPILSDNCFHCHGPDSASRKAGLRLDREEAAKAEAVVPGNPRSSELIARILSDDPDEVMPPPKTKKSLTPEQITTLRQWVEQGAKWQTHWAFIPPVKAEFSGENAIDYFVAEQLKAKKRTLSPPADARTLIRRVTLDLTGLPPTPQEIAEFLNASAQDAEAAYAAYAALVDRLLASPRYGEHRARYWLDAARYADTHGLHLDNYREMWPYRDWVIAAFNANQPFDQFTVEQLAGDLLPEPTQEQRIATGFNRCNVTTSEGGAIAQEFLVRYAVDRTNTTATVWMGLTAGCAQCHDHKFDPISQKEYYQLFAYFNNTTQPGMDGNAPDTPPVIRVYADDAIRQRESQLLAARRGLDEALKVAKERAREQFEAWRANPEVTPGSYRGWTAKPRFERNRPFTLALHVKAPSEVGRFPLFEQIDERGRGLRLVLDTAEEGIELSLTGESGGRLQLQPIKRIRPGYAGQVVFVYDGTGVSQGIEAYVDGRKLGRERFPYLAVDTLHGDFATSAPGLVLSEHLTGIAFYDAALSDEEIAGLRSLDKISDLLKKPAGEEPEPQLLAHFYHTQQPEIRKILAQRSETQIQLNRLHRLAPVTHVMQEKPGSKPVAQVLERGEYDKPSGSQVQPGVPEALPPLPPDSPGNRLELAQWLVRPDHPLTARVTVNRFWQEFFGVGLVKTSEDFGTQGELPSHPELLDWLAVDFVENGWNVKRLIRQIVTSRTYRQSSKFQPGDSQFDPQNRLLARGPRFRLDAEVLRDQALFASGLLVEKIGGPGVRPYQPDGLWQAVGYENSNTVKFFRHYGDSLYRRSIYTFWKRTSPPPNMSAFDAPNRESCVARRERTNTPLQALVLMNDVQFVEAARHLAERAMGEDDPISAMTSRVLARPFSAEERAIAQRSLTAFRARFSKQPEKANQLLSEGDKPNSPGLDPVELAALTLLANQILNLDETIDKN